MSGSSGHPDLTTEGNHHTYLHSRNTPKSLYI